MRASHHGHAIVQLRRQAGAEVARVCAADGESGAGDSRNGVRRKVRGQPELLRPVAAGRGALISEILPREGQPQVVHDGGADGVSVGEDEVARLVTVVAAGDDEGHHAARRG